MAVIRLMTVVMTQKLSHNKLKDGNSIVREEQSHSSCGMSLHAFSVRERRAQRANVVTQASVLLELSTDSRYPGGSRKVTTAPFLFNCTESNSSSDRRARTVTSFVARQSESFVRPHSKDKQVTARPEKHTLLHKVPLHHLRRTAYCARRFQHDKPIVHTWDWRRLHNLG